MQTETTAEIQMKKKPLNIHLLLSRSYSVYFFSFILGLIIDTIIQPKMGGQNLQSIGLIIIVFSSFLMYWAQTVNKKIYVLPNGKKDFTRGPYKWSRNPTQLGLFLLILGAGFIMNSYSILGAGILAFIFSFSIIIPEEEKRHLRIHGDNYLSYMKRVRRII